MRWGPFWLALLLVAVLQTAVLYPLGVRWLDLFLALALLCGLNAPTAEARLAGWLTGFAQDLFTVSDTLGLHALALGLCVLLLTWLRDNFNSPIWWARMVLALIAGWCTGILTGLYDRFWMQLLSATWGSILGASFLIALLAALVAVVCTELTWILPRRRGRRFRPAR